MSDDELIEAMVLAFYDEPAPFAVESMRAVLAVVREHDGDGERYRWLRDHYASVCFEGRELIWDTTGASSVLDAAIDAARGKE